jgi:hypothetical protein
VFLPAAAKAFAGDGTGTMTVAPTYTINGATGKFFTFTYTAAAGGMSAGEIDLTVPAGWTAPDPDGFNPGGSNALCGDSPVVITGTGPWVIHVNNVTLTGGSTCDIHYGINTFGTVTATNTVGTATFTTLEKSTSGGTLTTLAAGSPQVVVGTDGTGTMTASPINVVNGTSNTVTFTYTATRTVSGGELTLAVPAGWSLPSTTGTDPGFTTSDCPGNSLAVATSTIQVTGINLANAASCHIVFGATGAG